MINIVYAPVAKARNGLGDLTQSNNCLLVADINDGVTSDVSLAIKDAVRDTRKPILVIDNVDANPQIARCR